jgi:hypothetical protein
MASPSRRSVLMFISAAGAAVAAASLSLIAGPESLIESILVKRILSRGSTKLRMSQESLTALTADVMQAHFQSFSRKFAVKGGARVANIVGIDALAKWAITAELFQHFERQVITYFILGSDFLEVRDPKIDVVTYTATPDVCPNRFAQYDS